MAHKIPDDILLPRAPNSAVQFCIKDIETHINSALNFERNGQHALAIGRIGVALQLFTEELMPAASDANILVVIEIDRKLAMISFALLLHNSPASAKEWFTEHFNRLRHALEPQSNTVA